MLLANKSEGPPVAPAHSCTIFWCVAIPYAPLSSLPVDTIIGHLNLGQQWIIDKIPSHVLMDSGIGAAPAPFATVKVPCWGLIFMLWIMYEAEAHYSYQIVEFLQYCKAARPSMIQITTP